MRFTPSALAALGAILLLATGCDDDPDATVSGFVADVRTPAPSQVFLALDGASGSSVAISVRIREVAGLHAADLRLTYPPSRVIFQSFAPGTILEQGGGFIDYDVAEETPGALHIVARRTTAGDVSADATSPRLVQLAFEVLRSGTAPATFSASQLKDSAGDPLPGIRFFAGAFTRS